MARGATVGSPPKAPALGALEDFVGLGLTGRPEANSLDILRQSQKIASLKETTHEIRI